MTNPWAARSNAWLLIKLMPKGKVFSFPLLQVRRPGQSQASGAQGISSGDGSALW